MHLLSAFPDVEVREINEDWEFLILACDGIWDVLSNDAVIDFCRQRIAMGVYMMMMNEWGDESGDMLYIIIRYPTGVYPEEIAEQLMTRCLAPDFQLSGLGGDNMTVVLVCFLHGRPYEDLKNRCLSSLSVINARRSSIDDDDGGDDEECGPADLK